MLASGDMAGTELDDGIFRQLVEQAPDGVAILRDGFFVYSNQAAAMLFGFDSVEEVVGLNIAELIHPEDVQTSFDAILPVMMAGIGKVPPTEFRAKRRPERAVEVSMVAIEYRGLPAMLGFGRDVTERKNMQRKMLEVDRLAAVGMLAAGVAHEINNPLAYILLNLECLERDLGSDGSRAAALDRVGEATEGAQRVRGIVADLKAFVRPEKMKEAPVDVSLVVERALKIVDHELSHRASVVREISKVPKVAGDAARLEQVFVNLLVNAAHAIPEGEPESHRVRVAVNLVGDRVEIEVEDDGPGMDPEVRARVFEPFFSTKSSARGTGLGLAICRNIVIALGGEISVESEPGEGATLRVSLEVASDDMVVEPSEPPSPSSSLGRRGRVLIVDDEKRVAETLCELLDEHDVTVATGGAAALELLGSSAFDVVLCDLIMPKMSGMELYRTVKERNAGMATRFVFMTAGALLPQAREFLETVPNACIEKPFDLDYARQLVRRIVAAG